MDRQEHGLSLLAETMRGGLWHRWRAHMRIIGRPLVALRLALGWEHRWLHRLLRFE